VEIRLGIYDLSKISTPNVQIFVPEQSCLHFYGLIEYVGQRCPTKPVKLKFSPYDLTATTKQTVQKC
jgi:hypothetical protein